MNDTVKVAREMNKTRIKKAKNRLARNDNFGFDNVLWKSIRASFRIGGTRNSRREKVKSVPYYFAKQGIGMATIVPSFCRLVKPFGKL